MKYIFDIEQVTSGTITLEANGKCANQVWDDFQSTLIKAGDLEKVPGIVMNETIEFSVVASRTVD